MLDHLPGRVTIHEVGPRDGLQNEKAFIKTEDKVRLIRALVEAGVPRVEITSFVHPRWVPQLADGPHVAAQVGPSPGGGRSTARSCPIGAAWSARCWRV